MKNMIRKSLIIVIVMTLLAFTLTGCSGSGSASGGGGGTRILMTLHDDTDTFLITLVDAMTRKASSMGITLDIVYCAGDPSVQKQQVEKAAADKYDAIICRLADASTILQMEIAAGDVPIVFINNEPSADYLKADKYVYVGSYEQDAGRFQAEYIWNGLGKPSSLNVIILEGQRGHAAVPQRTNAVKYFFMDQGVKANIVFADYADWSDTVAYSRLDQFKITGQPFDCIIANNDPMALGAIEWLKDNGYDTKKVLVAGIDATAGGCDAIRSGDLYMTVLQDTAKQGEAAIVSAVTLAKGKSVSSLDGATEDLKYVWVPFVPITPENISQYIH